MLCEVKNSLDFGDLLIKLQHLLDSKPEIKNELAKRYKYILVDEFQDTNIIQMEIISSILSTHNNIMAVGDDDQAIYSFRGATVKNILNCRSSSHFLLALFLSCRLLFLFRKAKFSLVSSAWRPRVIFVQFLSGGHDSTCHFCLEATSHFC